MSADVNCAKDVTRRISITSAMGNKFSKLWRSTGISNETKLKLYETFVVPVLLHGSEYWCLRREDYRRILTEEMTWLRKCWRVRTTTLKIRNILCQETTLVDRIRDRRLNWFGHVSRMGNERLPAKALHSNEGIK